MWWVCRKVWSELVQLGWQESGRGRVSESPLRFLGVFVGLDGKSSRSESLEMSFLFIYQGLDLADRRSQINSALVVYHLYKLETGNNLQLHRIVQTSRIIRLVHHRVPLDPF